MLNLFKWFKKKKDTPACEDLVVDDELVELVEKLEEVVQPAIFDEMPEEKTSCCEGCEGCGAKEKPCSTRKLSDEMPKAKIPRIKRVK
jgi:hypothetical protein